MTFSICVCEPGDDGHRFGVAVTTRLPAVGTLCPFVSENGAVATQSLVNVDLGRRGVEYVDEGLAVDDALEALLNADDGREVRQLHGVDRDGTFTFSGQECRDWFGHGDGEGYTVAGNLLVGPEVIDATAAAYEESRGDGRPLTERLIDALATGHAEGGDKREDLTVQSAAVRVDAAGREPMAPLYDDLRVDATRTPIEDLRQTYELAVEGHEAAMEKYEEEDAVDFE